MSENKEKRKGNILDNTPCNKDYFEGSPHQKLANAIIDEIKNRTNGSIIGIDGEWGSGKSNIVGIIENNLLIEKEGKKKYHFFIYDAWKHQTDSPRRTILEELLSNLTTKRNDGKLVLDSKKWGDTLKDLLAKKKRINTIVFPSLGIGTIVSVFMILLTPFLTHLASIEDKDERSWILIVPYIVAYIIAFVCHAVRMYRINKKNKEKFTLSKFLSQFFLVYADEIKENTTYETISEREPSSRDFEIWFNDINKDLVISNWLLVLVFDNMDRLPKAKVNELWAVILSFFSEKKFSNIHIIVPFDRIHLRNAFEAENIIPNGGKSENENGKPYNYADDFINKTFSIVYTVPPPIMTGWMKFFRLKWKEAFGDKVKVGDDVIQIFNVLIDKHTPREIIAFINKLVTIRSTCDSNIEDKYIALYLAGWNEIQKDPLNEILSPKYLGSLEYLYKDDKNMQEQISSLHYQLPVGKAMDTIYVDEIVKELDKNKIELLEILKDNDIFWLVLNHSVTKVNNIENAALALDKCLENNKTQKALNVWDSLYKKGKQLNFPINEYNKSHAILMSHIDDIDKTTYYKHLLKQYHKYIIRDFAIGKFDVENYLKGVDTLQGILDKGDDNFIKTFRTEVPNYIFLKLIQEKGEKWNQYGLTIHFDGFDEYLSNLDDDTIAEVKVYPYIREELKTTTSKYVKKVRSLFTNKYETYPLIENLLNRIKEIEERPFDIRKYWEPSKMINIANNVKNNHTKLLPDIIAMAIAKIANPAYFNLKNAVMTYLDSDDDEVIIKSVAEVIEYYIDYGELLIRLSKNKQLKLITAVTRYLTINRCGVSRMVVTSVISSYEKILYNSDIKPIELINRLNDWADTIDLKLEDVTSFPIKFISDIKEVENKFTIECLKLAEKHLLNVSQEKWQDSLCKSDFNFKLLKVYHPVNLPLCLDAFKALLREYAMDESDDKMPINNVNDMISICHDLHIRPQNIFTEIRDVFINKSNISKEKLIYFGDWLLKYGNLGGKADSLNKIFQSQFLDDNAIVQILISNTKVVKRMVNKATNTTDFRNKMSALRQSKYKDNKEFKDFCDTLNIS